MVSETEYPCVETQQKEFYSIRELHQWLGISRSKSYELIQPGPDSLPAYRVGRRLLVRRSEVEEWLGNHRYYSEFFEDPK
jgi:excisionase family DNA binding protein